MNRATKLAAIALGAAAMAVGPLAHTATAVGGKAPSLDGTFVAVPGAAFTTYGQPAAVVSEGGSLTFTNTDVIHHTVTSDALDPDTGSPVFGTGDDGKTPVEFGQSGDVSGVSELDPGTYTFHCDIHSNMTGSLVVVGSVA